MWEKKSRFHPVQEVDSKKREKKRDGRRSNLPAMYCESDGSPKKLRFSM